LDPVVKPLDITVKKEAGMVVETSGEMYVVKPLAKNEFRKWDNRAPGRPKMRGIKNFLNF